MTCDSVNSAFERTTLSGFEVGITGTVSVPPSASPLREWYLSVTYSPPPASPSSFPASRRRNGSRSRRSPRDTPLPKEQAE